MRAAVLPLVGMLAACAGGRSAEQEAQRRLDLGDKRLIATIPTVMHGQAVMLVGVSCDRLDLPVRIVAFTVGDVQRARREWQYATDYNRAVTSSPGYGLASCQADEVLRKAATGPLDQGTLEQVEPFASVFDLPNR